ncbi:unnamed protein product [Symbiodinium natans]|uniref:Uncharacterized protein n=1 Tax=Symbiodinium natans TaxID=878477 RepID=A0A812JJ57_9DINO|nr:unnamed protein product [Symbiodinium natans]
MATGMASFGVLLCLPLAWGARPSEFHESLDIDPGISRGAVSLGPNDEELQRLLGAWPRDLLSDAEKAELRDLRPNSCPLSEGPQPKISTQTKKVSVTMKIRKHCSQAMFWVGLGRGTANTISASADSLTWIAENTAALAKDAAGGTPVGLALTATGLALNVQERRELKAKLERALQEKRGDEVNLIQCQLKLNRQNRYLTFFTTAVGASFAAASTVASMGTATPAAVSAGMVITSILNKIRNKRSCSALQALVDNPACLRDQTDTQERGDLSDDSVSCPVKAGEDDDGVRRLLNTIEEDELEV